MKASLYSIEVKYVNPRGTTNSREHNETMRRYGLDRHTTSAYLIAMKGIKTTIKTKIQPISYHHS